MLLLGRLLFTGGGATRPLPRVGSVEELHGDPAVWPRPKVWTRGQKWKPTSFRLNVVVRSPPLYLRGGPKWRDNYPDGPDHPVAPQSPFYWTNIQM